MAALFIASIFIYFANVVLAEPTDAEKATARLKVLSESMNTADISELRELIKDGCNVNTTNKYGATPLWVASRTGHTEIFKMLLEAGAEVNFTYVDGITPLITASQSGNIEIVKLLLKAGADVNSAHKISDETPLLIALLNKHSDIVTILREAGGTYSSLIRNELNKFKLENERLKLEVAKLKAEIKAIESTLLQCMVNCAELKTTQRRDMEFNKDQSVKLQAGQLPDEGKRNKAASVIEGAVTRVDNGESRVYISIGSSAGLKKGSRLHVIRGEKFICDIVIVKLSSNEAEGTLQLRLDEPQVGDTVTSKLE